MADHKPNKCYYKPNRTKPRYFTAKTAAQAYCKARATSKISQEDFIREVNLRCGWDDRPKDDDWKKKVQDVLDALEKVAEELLKQFGPGAIARVLQRIWRALPAPVKKAVTDWAVKVGKRLLELLGEVADKVRRLPPPPSG